MVSLDEDRELKECVALILFSHRDVKVITKTTDALKNNTVRLVLEYRLPSLVFI